MPETQGGSCEACKRKKCKCDRKLPACGQCVSSPQTCKYAENNKRGIPGGYLGALEARLNETEIALYNALCELRRLKAESALADHADLSEPLQSRQADTNKYSRMNEWTQYPLKESDDIKKWWKSIDNNKLLENPRVDQSDFSMMFDSERPLNLSNVEIQYQEQERPSPEVLHGQPPPNAVSFDLANHNVIQDFQANFQPGMAAQSQPSSSSGVVPPNSVRERASSYQDISYGMVSISSPVGNWNGGLSGGKHVQERSGGAGAATNRSQELSSRLKHKYY